MPIDAPAPAGAAEPPAGGPADGGPGPGGGGPEGPRGGGAGADHESSLRLLLAGLTAMRDGDFSVRLPVGDGLAGQVADRFNEVATLHNRRTRELVRVSRAIGREGRMAARLDEIDATGEWGAAAEAVNSLTDDLVLPTTEVSRVIAAVAEGDLTQHMALEIA